MASVARRLPTSRVWLYRLGAIALGLSVFVIGEVVCRFGGWGNPEAVDDPYVTFALGAALLSEGDASGVSLLEGLAKGPVAFRFQACARIVAYYERQGDGEKTGSANHCPRLVLCKPPPIIPGHKLSCGKPMCNPRNPCNNVVL